MRSVTRSIPTTRPAVQKAVDPAAISTNRPLPRPAPWRAPIAPAYDLIEGSDALTDDERKAICDGLLTPMLENIGKNRSGKSNWQTWHNAAMLSAGAVLGDKAWVERAIADPGNGFVDQMTLSVSDDGMWYENSWGYHFYTLSAMIHLAEYSRRLNIDSLEPPPAQEHVHPARRVRHARRPATPLWRRHRREQGQHRPGT